MATRRRRRNNRRGAAGSAGAGGPWRPRAILLVVAALGVLALLVGRWTFEGDPALVSGIAELGGQWVDRPAPPLKLQDVQGQPVDLREHRGKVVFLNFWASYCEPCRQEMPSMERLVRDYQDQGLVMIAVSYDKEPEEVQRFMSSFLPERQESSMKLWMDPSGESGRVFGTELIPETYILDREGQVVARFVNSYDWTRPEVRTFLERLLRES